MNKLLLKAHLLARITKLSLEVLIAYIKHGLLEGPLSLPGTFHALQPLHCESLLLGTKLSQG